jgi:hypothetical protein
MYTFVSLKDKCVHYFRYDLIIWISVVCAISDCRVLNCFWAHLAPYKIWKKDENGCKEDQRSRDAKKWFM